MLTLEEIKTAIRSNINYAHPEDIDDAAMEVFDMMKKARKQSQEPKLIQNENGQ